MSVFRIDANNSVPDVLSPLDVTPPPEDDLTNLMVIPIAKEIAPDFTLFGYNNMVRRIEEVLVQRGLQRNVMLYGDRGVGKTAIIHGLVQRKNNNDLSTHMYKRTFYRLNSSRLLHTVDVAEISRQFDQVLMEFGPYDTLVIEGFYTLITYLKLRGATIVLVGLLEALSLRKLQTIITCETREKPLILNEIPEAYEYFVPERVVEPTNDELLNILRGVHPSYEARYGIEITDKAICLLRDLTQKYRNGMEGWAQPGRALLAMDRSIASFSVRMNSKPAELTELESEQRSLTNEIESFTETNGKRQRLETRMTEIKPKIATLRQQWEQATAPIRKLQAEKVDYEMRLHRHIVERQRSELLRHDTVGMASHGKDPTTLAEDIQKLTKMIDLAASDIRRIDQEMAKINLSGQRDHIITDEFVAATISEISGIPPDQLTANERSRVLHMEEILSERVFGQTEAIKALSDAVRRARAGLSDSDNEMNEGPPKGSFLFLGPSGVGKTELGKALAEFLNVKLIRIDMSEFMEKHSVARLIGAPPGYAGHDEGGVLTKAVHDYPTAVVMLDEIEKAHEDVFKLFLQVLSDGRLTDGFGETVNFSDTIIIMTSNAGGGYFTDPNLSYEQATKLAIDQVNEFLLPEIRGRLDAIICFHRLDLSMLARVTKKRITALNRSLQRNHDAIIEIDDPDIEQFCHTYQDDRYGGRKMLTALKQTLEGTLAVEILKEANGAGVYRSHFNGTMFDVQFTARPQQ